MKLLLSLPKVYAITGVLLAAGTLKLFTASVPAPVYNEDLREHYKIFAVDLPSSVSFAGETVPLNDFDVRERLDRELITNTYWQSQTLLLMKRAGRYFPEIEKILKEEGIPADFKYLVLAESGLTNAVSPASATGFWQLMPNTATSLGLEVNENVDERYHLEKSTRAAARYLKEAKSSLGTWTLAAAAYNMGVSGVKRQQERQKETGYYNLLLNEETSRYVPRVLAFKLIFENPEYYGFHLKPGQRYSQLSQKEVKIDSTITDLADFAAKQKTSYKMLKILNPWMREATLENADGKEYLVRLPAKGFGSGNE